MFKDEHGNISKMLKTNLELANCDTLKDNFSSSILWLNEDSGCDTSGGDYTMINMREDT
ncbi:MAG: hypothetical protein H6767_06895 [Candidatus Peribacteria bacterium]|nr:MAG: hypothetical protein H6767_06895 [Candidatus Peribacteria bacterium]